MNRLTIGQVAGAANVNLETVKYYEKRGLLPKPARGESGYRMYSTTAVEDIRLIKRAQDIGFSLNEIKQLLAVINQESYFPAEEMQALAIAKIAEINEKITRLASFKSLLEQAVERPAHFDVSPKPNCPSVPHEFP
ncbi:MerR family mercuric resistance operon transcriptional regulator [Paenibacillus phyllosphaerae]|uniref:MerR family mercuric resistance operon transcriptional regulator n=1 Tax=Paenibacillus phyllosphaerae TaxID=274593 RepID=A0A7W5FR83_9BACL|nr:MerR family transcriptional regulator [Paenibacillus phyllosphaerae]MBB3114073.1 MerR family mercuric resistance operon transcriptional regulator [Paenibacillus phyllosphaerae]